MAQLPPVHMKLNPDNFDLLMTILAFHTEEREVPGLANDAHDLIDKRMRFSRLCTDLDGRQYVDIFMYEDEAVEMIWQFLFAAADADMAVCDYHSRLQKAAFDEPPLKHNLAMTGGVSDGEKIRNHYGAVPQNSRGSGSSPGLAELSDHSLPQLPPAL